jgi:hypothetical protein
VEGAARSRAQALEKCGTVFWWHGFCVAFVHLRCELMTSALCETTVATCKPAAMRGLAASVSVCRERMAHFVAVTHSVLPLLRRTYGGAEPLDFPTAALLPTTFAYADNDVCASAGMSMSVNASMMSMMTVMMMMVVMMMMMMMMMIMMMMVTTTHR